MDKKDLFEGVKQLDFVEKTVFFVQGVAETTVNMFAGLLGTVVDVSKDVVDINSDKGIDVYNKRIQGTD